MTGQGPWRVPGAQGGVVVRFPFADEFAQREVELEIDDFSRNYDALGRLITEKRLLLDRLAVSGTLVEPTRLHKGEGLGAALIVMLMAVIAGLGIALLIAAAVNGV